MVRIQREASPFSFFFFFLLVCFLSLLTSVVFNCEDISRWNNLTKKHTQTSTLSQKKNWNRIDYFLSWKSWQARIVLLRLLLAFFASLFPKVMIGLSTTTRDYIVPTHSLKREDFWKFQMYHQSSAFWIPMSVEEALENSDTLSEIEAEKWRKPFAYFKNAVLC